MGADHDLIKRLSTASSGLIKAQIDLSKTTIDALAGNPWMLGYCYGFVDAVCQAADIAQEKDFLLLFTVTFDEIAGGGGDLRQGADLVECALKKQQDAAFQEGVMQGGADFMAYRTNQNVPPMGLVEYRKQHE